MSYVKRVAITLTTIADGSCTAYSSEIVTGVVKAIVYVPGTLATGTDITMTGEAVDIPIWAESNLGTSTIQRAPRMATHSTAGAASLYAAGGTAVQDEIPLADERIKVVLAQGGNVTTGTVYVYIG